MSTRGLIGFKIDDKYKVMYNHSDSYPEWLGQQVVDFINDLEDIQKLKENASKVVLGKQWEKVNKDSERIKKYPLLQKEIEEGEDQSLYDILRNFQGIDIIKHIYNGDMLIMCDNFDFFKDSLFMEYAYIINLDNETLDLYKGFNSNPICKKNPLYNIIRNETFDGYYPAKYVGSFSLKEKIKENWMDIYHKT